MDNTFQLGDMTLNRLGFGAMRLAGETAAGPNYDRDNAVGVLQRAVELGVNFIDTADVYGPEVSENLIYEALHPYEGLTIATKGGLTTGGGPGMRTPNGSASHLRRACEASLERLGISQITLYQLHRPDPAVPIAESVGALFELGREGKIKHVGLSNVTAQELGDAMKLGPIVSVQNRYSILDRVHEDVLELCAANGIMFIPYFPIAGNMGGLRSEVIDRIAAKHHATSRQIGLAWLLQHSPVIVPIPGTTNLAHLAENMAARDVTLDADDVAQLDILG